MLYTRPYHGRPRYMYPKMCQRCGIMVLQLKTITINGVKYRICARCNNQMRFAMGRPLYPSKKRGY